MTCFKEKQVINSLKVLITKILYSRTLVSLFSGISCKRIYLMWGKMIKYQINCNEVTKVMDVLGLKWESRLSYKETSSSILYYNISIFYRAWRDFSQISPFGKILLFAIFLQNSEFLKIYYQNINSKPDWKNIGINISLIKNWIPDFLKNFAKQKLNIIITY